MLWQTTMGYGSYKLLAACILSLLKNMKVRVLSRTYIEMCVIEAVQ